MQRTLSGFIITMMMAMGLLCIGTSTAAAQQSNFPKAKEFRIERSMPPQAAACIACHRTTTPGIFADWAHSRHANANITCLDCHMVQPGDEDEAKGHEQYYNRSDLPYGQERYKAPVAAIVTPKDCSRCHMSGSGKVLTSHDVTERLSWETQAPLTIRPSDFKPFPAATDWQVERKKMKAVCQQCHGDSWIEDFYRGFDKVVEQYNEVYFKPARKMMDNLYDKGLLDKTRYFDEHLEVQFYELWHHEGRRARMGAMMMAPDYAWWHGFYECKKRLNEFTEEADGLIQSGHKAHIYRDYPNATGDTHKPPEIFGNK